MKVVGYALVLSALLGGGYFILKLINASAREACNRICPADPAALATRFDVGPFKYQECLCK